MLKGLQRNLFHSLALQTYPLDSHPILKQRTVKSTHNSPHFLLHRYHILQMYIVVILVVIIVLVLVGVVVVVEELIT